MTASKAFLAGTSALALALVATAGGAAAQTASPLPIVAGDQARPPATTALPAKSDPATTTPVQANDAGIGDIIVTAQRRSERLQDVPIAINAFSAADVNRLGIRSTTDIGQVTPNVNIALAQGPGNQPVITIRGIGINDTNTNNAGPIAIYSDEVYLSSPASQTFGLFDIDRIEVLKGPQGTLYGRNSSGGAISYTSAKPTDQFDGHLDVQYSSYQTVRVEGAVGGPIAPGVDARIAAVYDHSNGYIYNALTGNHENGANDYAVRAQVLAKLGDGGELLFNVHGGQLNTRPPDYGHYGDYVPGTQSSAEPTLCSIADTFANRCVDLYGYRPPNGYYAGEYNRQEHLRIDSLGGSIKATFPLGSLSLTSISAVEYSRKFEPEDSDASPNRLLEIDFGVHNTELTQEFRLAKTEGRLTGVVGLYYLHENLKQNQPLEALLDADKFPIFGIPAGPGSGDGIASIQTDHSRQVTDAGAGFGQAEFAATDRLKLVAGGRFTYERRTFETIGAISYQDGGIDNFGPAEPLTSGTRLPPIKNSNFSWRLGINYTLRPGFLTYVSVTTGYKSGTFNGGFLSTDPAQAAVQLQPVAPEHNTAYEVGVKSSYLGNRLIVNLSAFYNDYRNLQVFALVPSPTGPLNTLTNAQKVHTYGLDGELTVRPVPPLTLRANLGLLGTKVDEFVNRVPGANTIQGLELPFSPHFTTFLSANYHAPVGHNAIDLQFDANFKSRQFYDSYNDPYLAQNSYWLMNARIGYTIGKVEIAGFVKNIADKHYASDAFNLTTPFGFIQIVQGQPRWAGVELNLH